MYVPFVAIFDNSCSVYSQLDRTGSGLWFGGSYRGGF
jgi:hypothetical protein